MLLQPLVLAAAALGAAAHPSVQHVQHAHRRLHDKRVPGDVITATIDGQVVSWTATPPDAQAKPATTSAGSWTAPKPATTSAAAPTSSTAPAAAGGSGSSGSGSGSGSSSGGAGGYQPFCGGASSKRATEAQINYVGNTGSPVYGCNIMTVDNSIADLYSHTAIFTNADSQPQSCTCWNKMGPDGQLNGFFGQGTTHFTLPAGGSQAVAFDQNTQAGCSCGRGGVPTTSLGEYANTWLEVDMCNLSNNKWSGADISSLVAASAGMPVTGMQVCFEGVCSTILQGGQGNNAFVAGTAALDGIGINTPVQNVTLEVVVAYSGSL